MRWEVAEKVLGGEVLIVVDDGVKKTVLGDENYAVIGQRSRVKC